MEEVKQGYQSLSHSKWDCKYHIVFIPQKLHASFGSISLEEAKEFARVLQRTLLQLYKGLNNPDFNYIIHTAPIKDEHEDYFHWHLQILPRLVTPAGFELGTGMFINTALPEETAAFIREIPL